MFKLGADFKDKCDALKIDKKMFKEESKAILRDAWKADNAPDFVNITACLSKYLEFFKEEIDQFGDLIPLLTAIIKDKVGLIRKNAAVLIAKLATCEENKKIMGECHTM